jgi:maltose alpha-D-glucosyltransferase/alpha-amylase
VLAQRKQSKAMGRGTLEFLYPENRRILAFVRAWNDERVLVVANLSRFAQCVELDLSEYQGMTPLELFGKSTFPPVTDKPYFLSLGPHAYYWLALETRTVGQEGLTARTGEPPTLAVESLGNMFTAPVRATLNGMLPAFLRARRWFRSRTRSIRLAEISEVIPYPKSNSYLLLLRVEYTEAEAETYTLPLSVVSPEVAEASGTGGFVLARLQAVNGSRALLVSGLRYREFCEDVLGSILRRRRHKGEQGEVTASHTRVMRALWAEERPGSTDGQAQAVSKVDQDNSTVFLGDRFALKFLRKVEQGPAPELEIGTMLTATGFPNAAPLAGSIEYRTGEGEPMLLAVLHGFVRNATEAWDYTVDHLGLFFEHAMARGAEGPPASENNPLPPPELTTELIGSYLEFIRLLGVRTAEMHLALSSKEEDPVFAPESFTDFYRHGLYHGLVARLSRTLDLLQRRVGRLPDAVRPDVQRVLERQGAIRDRYRLLRDQRIYAQRIRIHGDYHLGQALYTGRDFTIIDFEGDPSRPQSERRIKRSPLEDVAGMLDSIYHAAHAVLLGEAPGVIPKPETIQGLDAWAKFWYRTVGAEFVNSYLTMPGISKLLPADLEQVRSLLRIYLLDLGVRKLWFEVQHAPERVRIPARGVIELVEG